MSNFIKKKKKIVVLLALSHLCSGQEKNVHTLSFSKGLISQCSAPGQLYLYSSAEKWKGKFRDIFSLLLSCNGHSFDLVRIFPDGSWDLRTLRTFWMSLRVAQCTHINRFFNNFSLNHLLYAFIHCFLPCNFFVKSSL